MIVRVVLIQVMPSRPDFFNYFQSQRLAANLYTPDEALGHADAFVAQHQLGGGTGHAVVDVADIVD